jgi:hypothetical protein
MYTEVENFLPHDECDKLIELINHNDYPSCPGEYLTRWHILEDGELCNHATYDEKVLKCEFFDFDRDHPLQQVMWEVVKEFADQNNIPLSHSPGLVVSKYLKDGHMAWHTDGFNEADKISIGVQLSDESSYDGGEFQFGRDTQGDLRTTSEDIYHDWELTQNSVTPIHTVSKAKGSLCMYDSFLYHRVTPVTRGERYVLLGWYRYMT